jgi:hypothetical protein
MTALSLAAAVGFAATLSAQTTSTTTQQRDRMTGDKHEITITGCLAKGADGNYTLTNAYVDKSTTTTTGTTGTTAAEPRYGKTMTWKLEGGSDLDRHVGHKIQVTGRTDWKDSMDRKPAPEPTDPPTTTGTSGTTTSTIESQRHSTTTDANQPKMDVGSVKMISSTCS